MFGPRRVFFLYLCCTTRYSYNTMDFDTLFRSIDVACFHGFCIDYQFTVKLTRPVQSSEEFPLRKLFRGQVDRAGVRVECARHMTLSCSVYRVGCQELSRRWCSYTYKGNYTRLWYRGRKLNDCRKVTDLIVNSDFLVQLFF